MLLKALSSIGLALLSHSAIFRFFTFIDASSRLMFAADQIAADAKGIMLGSPISLKSFAYLRIYLASCA
jgi:hypothetical protein